MHAPGIYIRLPNVLSFKFHTDHNINASKLTYLNLEYILSSQTVYHLT